MPLPSIRPRSTRSPRSSSDAESPALVVGAGADDAETWAALVELAERLVAPVFQESFGARAGFPQDHRAVRRASCRPTGRGCARRSRRSTRCWSSARRVFRQSPYAPGRFTEPGTRIAVVSDDADEVHRSPAELAVLAPPAAVCRELAARVAARDAAPPEPLEVPPPPAPPAAGEPMLAGHVLAALAERLPRDAVVVEEAPVDRPELHERLAAREPLGFLSAAMGGLGFALGGATGVRMARPERPVVAVVGDGSSIYGIQALWSAAHYRVGVLFVDPVERRLRDHGPPRRAPRRRRRRGRASTSTSRRSRARSAAPARRIDDARRARRAGSTTIVPTLASRDEPVLLDVVIAPTQTFAP